MLEKLGRIDLSFTFNPLLPITVEHLFYLSQVIRIWILEYPLQAFLQLITVNFHSCKGWIQLQKLRYNGREKDDNKLSGKGQIRPRELQSVT